MNFFFRFLQRGEAHSLPLVSDIRETFCRFILNIDKVGKQKEKLWRKVSRVNRTSLWIQSKGVFKTSFFTIDHYQILV